MSSIELIRLLLVFVHLIGLAAVIGAYILQMPWTRGFDFRPLTIGATVSLLSGLALVAVHEVGDLGVDRWKIVTKLLVALTVLAVSLTGLMRARRRRRANEDDAQLKWMMLTPGLLAMGNVAVALFWR